MVRLFVAVWPSDGVRRALRELIDGAPDESGVRLVPPDNWHITLRFVGDAETDAVVDRLGSAVLPAATATLGPAIERLGRRQFVIPVAGVDDLAGSVRRATESIGTSDPRRFSGHLTVARTKPGARSSLVGRPFSATMQVVQVALVASILAPAGARYTTLAQLPTHR